MNLNTKKLHISSLLALALFGVFAVCTLSVLLTGADVYRRLTLRDQENYDRRTGAQYLATKVRQSGLPGGVSVGPFGDGDALLLSQDIGGEAYLTRIYCHGGWLMELFSSVQGEFEPQDGEKVLQAQALSLDLTDGLLSISITGGDGTQTQLALALRVGEEAVS